ncbi:MAG: Rieske (2Fe-2S) protein, partial [Chloroflexi bacterium]|nr:Rieske (2Fe-2S) protein [Chloroflexota bacterium]
MATAVEGHIRVGTLDQVKERGCSVVTGGGHTLAVFYHDGQVYALDNRCPHMGFPLDRGSIRDGILTCHWHHARFDLSSGGTFNLFADDVRSFPVSVIDGEVWVNPSPPPRDETTHWSTRLEDGLEHNIRLIIGKAVLGLNATGADYRLALKIGARFGTTYSASGWGPAMSILTCSANMLPHLSEEDRTKAMYQGLLHVSRECAGKPPRFLVNPLPTHETRPEVLKQWFRSFIDVRDEEGAERCLSTAIELGLPQKTIADMVFAAATDHLYLDSGHVVDYANKAFELLDHLGWQEAGQVLTSLVHGMARARRSQELNSWRHPVDLAALVWAAREELPGLYDQGSSKSNWKDEDRLATVMLGDDPVDILESIKEAIRSGATPESLGSAVAYAAFLRMAHFHVSNEFRDWDTVHNTLTAANALHQALKRAPSVELLRGVFDTAISI